MALVLGRVTMGGRNSVLGDRREIVVDATLDSSYPASGYPLTARSLGFDSLDWVLPIATTSGHTFGYDYAFSILHVFIRGAEVTAATDLSAVVLRIVAHGKGSGL